MPNEQDTPERRSVERLREAIDEMSFASEPLTAASFARTDAALAAVEREMAELRADRDHCQRLYLEACELGSGHARIVALEAEMAELRKERDALPTPRTIHIALSAWMMRPRDARSQLRVIEDEFKRAEKAKATEAPRA